MKRPEVEATVAPNLVPMIDIMFLLLLFFMLSADMGQREIEDVRLPAASATREPADRRVTVNIYHSYDVRCGAHVCREERHWRVGIRGRDFGVDGIEAALARVADHTVHIRADRAAPYGLPQRVMLACAKVGIFKVEVGAAKS